MGDRRLLLRLFLTIWLVYGAHATSNVARETYLAVALAERGTVRVDPYLGLHPDLFQIPGRGAYINSNPGASMLGAIPYAVALPLIDALFRIKPSLGQPKPPASYDDPRPMRAPLMNAMRARGLDIRLALAAFATQFGLMGPLAALACVLVFLYLRARLGDERTALWLAITYGVATPIFFRSAFLNQNVLLAHAVLAAWTGLTWPGHAARTDRLRAWLFAGLCLGIGVLLDYSAAPIALVFGVWAVWEGWVDGRFHGATSRVSACAAGALGPVLVLLAYQWVAFGSPWYPAQHYMPATEFSMRGWNGMTLPTLDLLWRNLFDLRYGLFLFCPLLIGALAAPFLAPRSRVFSAAEVVVMLLASAALWLFNSANQYANLQWNTGVRYMVPAVPLLFMLAVPVLLAIPAWGRAVVILPTAVIAWAVSMVREDVPHSLALLLTQGPTLPMLVVLRKTAQAYAPWLADGLQPFGAASIIVLLSLVAVIWKGASTPDVRPEGQHPRS